MGIESFKGVNMPRTEWSMSDAIAEIGLIEERVRKSGAVDTEPSQLALLRSKVINSEMTPQQAVEEAKKIEESRQEYH